jgi:hypothetical protein
MTVGLHGVTFLGEKSLTDASRKLGAAIPLRIRKDE